MLRKLRARQKRARERRGETIRRDMLFDGGVTVFEMRRRILMYNEQHRPREQDDERRVFSPMPFVA